MMADREKVIHGLELVKEDIHERFVSGSQISVDCLRIDKAIAMLKEQEAVKPLAKEDDSYECICGTIVGWDELDASGIVQTRLNYCPFCGKPILWEGR